VWCGKTGFGQASRAFALNSGAIRLTKDWRPDSNLLSLVRVYTELTFHVIEMQTLGGAMLNDPFTIERKRAIDPHRIDAAAETAAFER